MGRQTLILPLLSIVHRSSEVLLFPPAPEVQHDRGVTHPNLSPNMRKMEFYPWDHNGFGRNSETARVFKAPYVWQAVDRLSNIVITDKNLSRCLFIFADKQLTAKHVYRVLKFTRKMGAFHCSEM